MDVAEDIIVRTEKLGAKNYQPLPIVIAKAAGVWVTDPYGNRYMDLLSSYSALNFGHRHPEIIQALKNQAERVTLTSRAFHNDQLVLLYEKLAAITGKNMFLPMNTGVEAVETAVKAARRWGYERKAIAENQCEIIVCAGNFHGRTLAATSMSSEAAYKRGFGPFVPGFTCVPYGDIPALAEAITPNTAALLIEPMQGEAGVIIPPAGFVKEAWKLCKQRKVLLIADEIQTGFGRTGKMFACDWDRVSPDLYVLGKALGGGVLPVSAVAGDAEILGVFTPGSHGSTFGGNPLACAVAVAALNVLEHEDLVNRSRRQGEQFLALLKQLSNPLIKEVRGKGLFMAIELSVPARPYCEKLMELGLLCKETHGNIIRLTPPLIIEPAEIRWAYQRIAQVLGE